MEDNIELKVKGKLWTIRECSSGVYEILVNEKVLAYYHRDYPEVFIAAWKRALSEVRDELGIPGLPY